MSTMRIIIDERTMIVTLDEHTFTLPVGVASLRDDQLHSDPPRPEELTNAIGLVFDHMDDVVRAAPHAIGADVELVGAEVTSIVAVEIGGDAVLPFTLTRDAAEDVFRTLATERAVDRRRNPGLDPAQVDSVVAGCCAVVAVLRRLQATEAVVHALDLDPEGRG